MGEDHKRPLNFKEGATRLSVVIAVGTGLVISGIRLLDGDDPLEVAGLFIASTVLVFVGLLAAIHIGPYIFCWVMRGFHEK